MSVTTTAMPGVKLLAPVSHSDDRGDFTKTFVAEDFAAVGLPTVFAEEFFTRSIRGTVRGMHFQSPPFDHSKLVYCVSGAIFDVVLDLRVGSPSFAQCAVFRLAGAPMSGVFVPAGCAHGFACISDEAVVSYHVTSAHEASHDTGILWSSIGIQWPFEEPIISARDAGLIPLRDFESPFVFVAER